MENIAVNTLASKSTTKTPTDGWSCFEPKTQKEARSCRDAQEWYEAEKKEIQKLQDIPAWTAVPLPKGQRALGSRFVYKLKYNEHGEVVQHKARFVVRGDQEPECPIWDRTASCTTYTTLRCVCAYANHHGFRLEQRDVQSAYTCAEPKRDQYIRQPKGHELPGHRASWVLLLQRALYGMQEAGNDWQRLLRKVLTAYGFSVATADENLYLLLGDENDIVILVVWVDDFVITGHFGSNYDKFVLYMDHHFVTTPKTLTFIVGIKVDYDRDQGKLTMCAPAHIERLLETQGMADCKPVDCPSTPNVEVVSNKTDKKIPDDFRSPCGSLVHLARTCRPDIAYATTALCRVADKPTADHRVPLKRVFRYLKGTTKLGFFFFFFY